MNRTLHQVWIQGEAQLPSAYADNRRKWMQELPGWNFILWDNAAACSRWPEYAAVQERCSHHAMRADLILARALRDFGGMSTGTDVVPNNIPNLLAWLAANDSLVIANIAGKSASNGLAYFSEPNHPFISCVCRHQFRDLNLFTNPNVWAVTGPGCWWQALASRMWNLSLATDDRAYTRLHMNEVVTNPTAWVDPGYAGSWHRKDGQVA